jgi:hypothetical protein
MLQEMSRASHAKNMKLTTGISEDGTKLYLVVNTEEDHPVIVEMTCEKTTELIGLLYELVRQSKAQTSFLEMESSTSKDQLT